MEPVQHQHLDESQEFVYIAVLQTQGMHAKMAVEHYNRAFQSLDTGGVEAHLEVFRQIHSFLTHASNISRLFFPQRPSRRREESDEDYNARLENEDRFRRGRHLRELFEIAGDSPLANRTLRNHLEHFDERLDEWRSKHRSIMQDTIAARGAIVGFDLDAALNWYDPSTLTFWFRTEPYDIQALVFEVSDVAARADQLYEAGMRKRTSMGPV